jgi:hypothetical protein
MISCSASSSAVQRGRSLGRGIDAPGALIFLVLRGLWAVLAHEGGEHLHDGAVIAGRVAGDALQGIDPAQAHIEPVVAELLDGLGEAIGDLPLAVQLKGSGGEEQTAQ